MKMLFLVVALGCANAWNNPLAERFLTGQDGWKAPTIKNIVELAESQADLSTLVKLIKAAKLVTTLEGAGPFTVFAPTDDAFNKIPQKVIDELLEPKNLKTLQAVLEYHVLAGAVLSKDLKPYQKVKTLEGQTVDIDVRDGKVYLDNGQGDYSEVEKADVLASNGVVHIVDRVEFPPQKPHLYFFYVNEEKKRCGQVDAAPSMPAKLFAPEYRRQLEEYVIATETAWDFEEHNYKLHTGECRNIGYSQDTNKSASVPWALNTETMKKICGHCRCDYPACPDNPKIPDGEGGNFCSLCGPKANAPRSVEFFTRA